MIQISLKTVELHKGIEEPLEFVFLSPYEEIFNFGVLIQLPPEIRPMSPRRFKIQHLKKNEKKSYTITVKALKDGKYKIPKITLTYRDHEGPKIIKEDDILTIRVVDSSEEMTKNYKEIQKKWNDLEKRYREAGIEIPKMPNEYALIEKKYLELISQSPSADIEVSFDGNITVGVWNKVETSIKNIGKINIKNIKLKFISEVVDVRGETDIEYLKKGEEKKTPLRLKSKDSGYVPVEVLVKYRNPLTGEEEKKKAFPEIFVSRGEETIEKKIEKISSKAASNSEILELKPDINKLGAYEMIQELGNGKFGIVYKVKRKADGEIAALKLPKIWDEYSSEQFIDEVSMWQNLWRTDKKHIVGIFRKSASPFGYIEMEYMEKAIDDLRFPVDPKVASEYMLSVAYALYTAHSQKPPVIHMDIKPSNILINSQGIAKLGDWGIAGKKYKDSDLSGKGTLDFCSPEVIDPIQYGKANEQSDIFSFGSTFYYILTGVKPFSGKTEEETIHNILSKDFIPKKPSEHNSNIPEVLDRTVMSCIQKSRDRRYKWMVEVIYVLSEYLRKPLDLSSGSSTNLLSDVIVLRAERGDIVETQVALKELIRHLKSKKIREDAEKIIEVLDEYKEMDEGTIKGNPYLMQDEEMINTIKEIAEKARRGR